MANAGADDVWGNIGQDMDTEGSDSGYETENNDEHDQGEAPSDGNFKEWCDAAEHLKSNEPSS